MFWVVSTLFLIKDMWKQWTEDKLELFIYKNIKQQEVEKKHIP
jgi:hypothetical protein